MKNFSIVALALSLVNPYFVWNVNMHGWNYAYQRIGVTIFCLALFSFFLLPSLISRRAIELMGRLNAFPAIVFAPFAFMLLAVPASIYYGNKPGEILADLYPVAEFYMYLFIGALLTWSQTDYKFLFKAIVTVCTLTAVFFIYRYFTHYNEFYFGAIIAGLPLRRIVDFQAVVALPLAAIIAYNSKKKFRWYLCIAIILVEIVFSLSRSLWAALALSALVISFLHRRLIRNLVWGLAVFAVIFAATFFIPYSERTIGTMIVDRFVGEETGKVKSIAKRAENVIVVIDEWAYNSTVILGKGPGADFLAESGVTKEELSYGKTTTVFSLWLWFLLKYGLIGVTVFVLFLVSVAKLLLVTRKVTAVSGYDGMVLVACCSSISAAVTLLSMFNALLNYNITGLIGLFSGIALSAFRYSAPLRYRYEGFQDAAAPAPSEPRGNG